MKGLNKNRVLITETPEAFVVVILLLGLMTFCLMAPSRLDIHKFQSENHEDRFTDKASVICLSQDGQIWFGRDSVKSLAELQANLARRLNTLPAHERNVYLKASPLVQYGEVVKVTDAIAAIGVKPVNFVTKRLRK